MGTPNDLHPRSKQDVLNDMATDPQYVMTENDAHVIGRDLEIVEAIFNTDFKKVKKYLRYSALRDLLKNDEPFGRDLMLTDGVFDKHATEVAIIRYPQAKTETGTDYAKLFLTKSSDLVLVERANCKSTVQVFGSLKYLCEHIDSNVAASRRLGNDPYWCHVKSFAYMEGHDYKYAATALAVALQRVMDVAIDDRRKWLETLESASATAKRRIAQIDY